MSAFWGQVPEPKALFGGFDRLTVHFGVRIDEVVEWLGLVLGVEADVAPYRELDAMFVESTKEVVFPRRVFPCLRCVHGYPADTFDVELGPAVVAWDVASRLTRG